MAKAHIEQAAISSEARDQSEGSRTRGYGQIANESIEASTMIVNENARPPIRCGEHVQRRRDTPISRTSENESTLYVRQTDLLPIQLAK